MENHEFLFDVLIILFAAKLFATVAKKFDLPGVVGFILAGVLIGPGVFSIVSGYSSVIESVSQVGVILLMFSAGIEADLSKLKKTWLVSLLIALFGTVSTLVGVTFVGGLFGIPVIKSVFLAVALCACSTSIIVQTLHDMGKLDSNAGSAIVNAAVFDDVLGVVVLSIASNFGGGEISYSSIITTVVKIVSFLAFASIFCFIVYKLLVKFSKNFSNSQSLAASALIFAFLLSYIAIEFGMAEIIGSYFAGLAFCQLASSEEIMERVEFLSSLFFTPIFFISIGLQASFDSFSTSMLLFCLAMTAVSVFTKLTFCALAARLCKYSTLDSVRIGIGMVARGEVTFIVANKGILLGLMDKDMLSPLIVIVITTTILAPIMLKYAFAEKNKPGQKLPSDIAPAKTASHA